jgi:predicted metal-dependent phosphoesterase TrpH
MEEVETEARATAADSKKPIGRPHIAAVLLRKGYVNSIKAAFDKYLAQGGAAYFDKERLSRRQAMELIRQSGGLPVLAHPVQLRTENDGQLERVVKDLLDLGLAGIEVIHSDHDAVLFEKYSALADRFGLLKTGGSDFHGTNKKNIDLGTANGRRVPRAYLDALLEKHRELKRAG